MTSRRNARTHTHTHTHTHMLMKSDTIVTRSLRRRCDQPSPPPGPTSHLGFTGCFLLSFIGFVLPTPPSNRYDLRLKSFFHYRVWSGFFYPWVALPSPLTRMAVHDCRNRKKSYTFFFVLSSFSSITLPLFSSLLSWVSLSLPLSPSVSVPVFVVWPCVCVRVCTCVRVSGFVFSRFRRCGGRTAAAVCRHCRRCRQRRRRRRRPRRRWTIPSRFSHPRLLIGSLVCFRFWVLRFFRWLSVVTIVAVPPIPPTSAQPAHRSPSTAAIVLHCPFQSFFFHFCAMVLLGSA